MASATWVSKMWQRLTLNWPASARTSCRQSCITCARPSFSLTVSPQADDKRERGNFDDIGVFDQFLQPPLLHQLRTGQQVEGEHFGFGGECDLQERKLSVRAQVSLEAHRNHLVLPGTALDTLHPPMVQTVNQDWLRLHSRMKMIDVYRFTSWYCN
eukprot:2920250-Rhodomonas_salina.4